jgi:hypothetical protein
MKKLHTIFIINLLHAKFVMQVKKRKTKVKTKAKKKNTKGTPFDDLEDLLTSGSKVEPRASATKLEHLVKKIVNHFHVSTLDLFPKCIEEVVDTSQQKAWGELKKPHLQQWESLKNNLVFLMLTIMIPC